MTKYRITSNGTTFRVQFKAWNLFWISLVDFNFSSIEVARRFIQQIEDEHKLNKSDWKVVDHL